MPLGRTGGGRYCFAGDLLIALAPAALRHFPKQGRLHKYHSVVKRDVHIPN